MTSRPGHRRTGGSRAGGPVAFAAAVLVLAGCTAGPDAVSAGTAAGPDAVSTSTADAAPPATSAAPTGSATPATSPSTSPSAIDVDFSGGRDAPGMAAGIPSPAGWYEAALGPRPQEPVLYLTFDDGPASPYTERLLDLLAANDARATFFQVGSYAAQRPDLVQRIADEGHGLGNHSWSHPDLLTLSRREVRQQLADTQEAQLGLGGGCMRPPYGLIDEAVADVAYRLDLVPIMWTGHAGDWNPRTAADLARRLRQATEPGAVLLLHDGGGDRSATVEAVARLLPWWTGQGYRLEPLPPCVVPPA